MLTIKKIIGREVFEDGLDNQIVELDRQNMSGILTDAAVTFPEEMRRKGFENNPVIFIALIDDELVGYLQYARSWDNERDIYLSSIQILPDHRNGSVLTAILKVTRQALMQEKFDHLVSEVLKNNVSAVRLYKKLGFTLTSHPHKRKYYSVTGTRGILENSPAIETINRHNKRMQLDRPTAGR